MINSLKKNLLRLNKFKQNEAILIFGDPRSGSTWLTEIIGKKLNACIVDEPLHLNNDERLKKMNYGWRQHIPEDANHSESFNFFSDLFRGKNLNAISLHKNNLLQTVTCEKLVYKIIRGKLLLPYLLKNFDFNSKPIFLIRHPLAVLHSMRLHEGWNFSYTPFQVPDTLYNEIYIEHQDFLMSLKSQEEIMISLWSLSNRNLDKHKVNLIYYEDLLRTPKETLSSIKIFGNHPLDEVDFSFKSKTVGDSYEENALEQMSKWKAAFTSEELKTYQSILDYFEISSYNINSPLPVK